MTGDSQLALVLALFGTLVLMLIVVVMWQNDRRRLHLRIERLIGDHQAALDSARKDSVLRSRSSLIGGLAEQLAPLLPGFPYNPSDARFLGDPVDYVVFHGYSDHRENAVLDEEIDVILLEIKQGSGALSASQRAIGNAVEQGRVRFEVTRVAQDGSVATDAWPTKRVHRPPRTDTRIPSS